MKRSGFGVSGQDLVQKQENESGAREKTYGHPWNILMAQCHLTQRINCLTTYFFHIGCTG
jgi:hypothetical protein